MAEPTRHETARGRLAIGNLWRPPRRQNAILVLVGALCVMAACWYFGTDVWHAIAIGASAAVIGELWVAFPDDESVPWRPEILSQIDGTRDDVRQLSWSLHGQFGRARANGRLADLAERRLAIHQLDLRNPDDHAAIERLIGSAAYTTLSVQALRAPTLRAVVQCLDALDALDPAGAAPHTAPIRTHIPDIPTMLSVFSRRTHHDR